MAAVNLQTSGVAGFPASLSTLQGHLDDTWSQLVDLPIKAGSLKRVYKEAERVEANIRHIENEIPALEAFVETVATPEQLTRQQLERVVQMSAEAGQPFGNTVENAGRMGELADQLEGLAGRMAASDRVTFRELIERMRLCAGRWRQGQERIQAVAQRWRDEMIALRLLGELGKRRPLTTTERILMLRASVIDTPVIHDPSDCRVDWYDDDGR